MFCGCSIPKNFTRCARLGRMSILSPAGVTVTSMYGGVVRPLYLSTVALFTRENTVKIITSYHIHVHILIIEVNPYLAMIIMNINCPIWMIYYISSNHSSFTNKREILKNI